MRNRKILRRALNRLSFLGFWDYIVTSKFTYIEWMLATTITDIQEGHSPLYSSALIMFGWWSYIIKPHFHNQDLVSKPIAANLQTGEEVMINVLQPAPKQSVPEKCSIQANHRANAMSSCSSWETKPSATDSTCTNGQTIKVLKLVKANAPKPSPAVLTSLQETGPPIAQSTTKADFSQSGLEILAEEAAINAEKCKNDVGGQNLVSSVHQREGQTGMVPMKSGFTTTEKECIMVKNLGIKGLYISNLM